MKNIVLLITLFSLLISCDKENQVSINDMELKGSENISLKNGVLCLPANYTPIVDSLLLLSRKERTEWGQKIGFESYNDVCLKVYEELELVNSKSEFYQCVKKYSKLVMFNEDSVVEEIIPYEFFRSIANKDKQFYIGDILFQVEQDGVYKITGGQKEFTMDFASNNSICHKSALNNPLSIDGMITTSVDSLYRYNGDKKTRLKYKIYRVSLNGHEFDNSYRIEIDMRTWVKMWYGSWKGQKTKYYYRNLYGNSLSYDVKGVSIEAPNGLPWYSIEPFNFPGNVYSPDDDYSYSWTFPIYVDEPFYRATINGWADHTTLLRQLSIPWFDDFHIECGSRSVGYTAFNINDYGDTQQ